MKGIGGRIAYFLLMGAVALCAAESQNLLTNGGFESGVTGWSLGLITTDGAAATRTIDSISGDAKEGKCFYRINVTAVSSENWHIQQKDPTWEAKLNYIYHFTMWARADSARNAQISVYGGAESKDTYRANSVIALTTEWKQYHQMFICDAAGMGRLNFAFVCGFAPGVYDIDDVVITGEENIAGTLYANGGFEADGAGWSLYVNSGEGTTGAATVSYPETGAQSGSKFCRVSVTAMPEQNWEVQLQDGSWTCEANTEYTISFWAKTDQAGAEVQVAAQAGSAWDYAYLDGKAFSLTTEWAEYEFTYTADTVLGTDAVSFNIYCGSALGVYDFDNITLSTSPVAVRHSSTVSMAQLQPFAVHLLREQLRCIPDADASIDRITIHDVQGRQLLSRWVHGSAGASYDLPLPRSGTWIVGVTTTSRSEQCRTIVVP